MRVGFGVTMTRKVFHRRQNAVVLQCQSVLCAALSHADGVFAKASHPYYRIGWLAVDVDVRSKVYVDAKAAALLGYLLSHLAYQFKVLDSSECHLIRIRNAVIQSHAQSPLAVYAYHHWSLSHRLPFVGLTQQTVGIGAKKRNTSNVKPSYQFVQIRQSLGIGVVGPHVDKLPHPLLNSQ